MQQFTDLKGDTWNLSFTVGDAFKLKRELGIDVDQMISGGDQEIQKILSDMWRLVEMLVLLLGPQIEAKGLLEPIEGTEKFRPKDIFFDRLGGDVLDTATVALLMAIGDSLPKLKRRAFLAMVAKLSPTIETAAAAMEAKIQAMDFTAMVTTEMEKFEP